MSIPTTIFPPLVGTGSHPSAHCVFPAHAVDLASATGRQAPARRQEAGRGIKKNAWSERTGIYLAGEGERGGGPPAISKRALVRGSLSGTARLAPFSPPKWGRRWPRPTKMSSADFHKVLQNYHSLGVNLVLSTGRTGTISLVATVGSPS